MKKLLLIPILCCTFIWAPAQERVENIKDVNIDTDEKKKTELQLGLNATYFVSNFLGLNQNELVTSPYAFVGKLKYARMALRFGIGAESSNETQSGDFASNIFDRKKQGFDLRIGIERQQNISARWSVYYGLDALVGSQLDQTRASSVFDEVVTRTLNSYVGGGPLLGVQFNINKRISLSTEGSFYTQVYSENQKNSFLNFPEQNTEERSSRIGFNTSIPSELFFIIHF